MEEFDDDDFSDLYADVEVQASSAISALHRSTELPPRSDRISATANAPRGVKKAADERDAAREEAEKEKGGGGVLRNLPVENGDKCESMSASWSEGETESEDGLASDGDDEVERKVGENYEPKRYEEISGKEKSVNGEDYNSWSQRKKLQYSSSNSKMKRIHEMAQQVGRKGNEDDRNLFFSGASEDIQPNYGRKHGGPKMASERHTKVSHPVPLDLDKRGRVQISDLVEDSPCEVSDSDSDGISEASDDRNRRKASCISNKVSSAREPEPFKSSWSQRGQGYTSSPSRAALGSRYIEKSPKRLRYSSPSLHCESQEPIAHKYRPPKHSESRGLSGRRGTTDGGYHERWRDSTQEHSNQPKKSNYLPYFKDRPGEDASYATDANNLYNRHVNHRKQRAMVDLKYIKRDTPYHSHSERMSTYSGGRLPDLHMGQPFLKDQYWWDNPNNRFKAGPPDGHNTSERQNFLHKRSSQMDYESLEYNRYHNQRRHRFQRDIEGLRNLSPEYSSAVDQRGTQFMYKGEGEHLRRRTRQNSLSPLHDYDDRFVERKYRRIHPSSGGDRDHLDCKYDRNVAHDRRKVESSSRGNRRHHSPLNSSENLCYIENEVNDRRNIKYRPFPFYSPEKPYASSRGEFLGASEPKTGVAQRNMRCSWNEIRIEYDQYGTDVATFLPRERLRYPPEDFHVKRRDYQPSSNTNFIRKGIKDDPYQDHFVGRRRNQHSEVFLPKEDVYKSRQQDNIVYGSEKPSRNSERILKNDEADDRPASCRIMELSEREMGWRNSNILGVEENSNHFDGCLESTKLNSHAQTHPSNQDSVDRLVVMGRKCTLQSSIRGITEAGEGTYYGRCDLLGSTDNKEPNNSEDMDKFKPEKTLPTDGEEDASLSDRNQQSKFSKNHQNESVDIEEGQIITEEIQSGVESHINDSGHPETILNDNAVVEKLDDEKIKEIIMKMERRRERFKEPIMTSKNIEKTFSPLLDSNVETAEARLERPARKRRWLGT